MTQIHCENRSCPYNGVRGYCTKSDIEIEKIWVPDTSADEGHKVFICTMGDA